jgi:SSS family solute:Na+ symporter
MPFLGNHPSWLAPHPMTLFGLHWIDSLILIAYVIAVLVIGKAHSGNVKGEDDFFLGGRSLGKWFQFFLSFGNMTDPGQATTTASSVYRQGAGGAWLALITLFLTPYYWFTNVWFRRVRLTTMADLFHDRFGRRFLATLYAVSTILMAVVGIAGGNVVALKTLQPMMVKPEAVYTAADHEKVGNFAEFSQLRKERLAAALPAAKAERYEVLKGFYDRGELQPYISYLTPVPFYLVSSLLVAAFVMLGGLGRGGRGAGRARDRDLTRADPLRPRPDRRRGGAACQGARGDVQRLRRRQCQ